MQARERYTLHGPEGCNDVDLLALVLGTGAGGRSARAIALDLLEELGSLWEIRAAPVQRLAEVRGVGPVRAIRLHAALTVGARAIRRKEHSDGPVRYAIDAASWFVAALDGLVEEELHALYLDARRRPLAYRRLTRGTDAATIIDARQVLSVALALRARAVVLGHNHPSGSLDPSPDDVYATQRVVQAAGVVGIEVLDHLIVAGETWVSLAELGHMDTPHSPGMPRLMGGPPGQRLLASRERVGE